MALAGGVFHQAGIPGAENLFGTVAEADFQLPGKDDYELPPGGRVPIGKIGPRPLRRS